MRSRQRLHLRLRQLGRVLVLCTCTGSRRRANQPRQLPPTPSPALTTPAAPEISDEEKKEQTADWNATLKDLPILFSEDVPESTGATVAREDKKRKGMEARAAAKAKVAKISGRYMEASLKRAVPAEGWKWQRLLGKAISRRGKI